jgi:hypothetical protein
MRSARSADRTANELPHAACTAADELALKPRMWRRRREQLPPAQAPASAAEDIS